MRVPKDTEITATAVELGLIQPGEPVPPRVRSKVAKTIQLAGQLDADEDAEATAAEPASDGVSLIVSTYTGLVQAGAPNHVAARIAAALAPEIWRTESGAAHDRT